MNGSTSPSNRVRRALSAFLPVSPLLSPSPSFFPALTPSTNRLTYRTLTPTCRMNRSERPANPTPAAPTDPASLHRAIELLGCFTQTSRLRSSTRAQLQALLGVLPSSRREAQLWKAQLQRAKAHSTRQSEQNPFVHRKALMASLNHPTEKRHTSRAFILLEVMRKRLSQSQPVTPRVREQLQTILSSVPQSPLDAHRHIKALAAMDRQRMKAERRPPRLPKHSWDDLHEANMLLGIFEVRGSVGKQSKRLEQLIGALPRTTNVAHSWKRIVVATIRKKARLEKANAKRAADDAKRLERRLRRMRHLAEQDNISTNPSPDDSRTDAAENVSVDSSPKNSIPSVHDEAVVTDGLRTDIEQDASHKSLPSDTSSLHNLPHIIDANTLPTRIVSIACAAACVQCMLAGIALPTPTNMQRATQLHRMASLIFSTVRHL